MKLLDTTEELEATAESYPPHGSLMREHEKFRSSHTDEDKLKRLGRIQKIVKADSSSVLPAMELMLSLQSQEGEVALQVREVLLDCLIQMLDGRVSMDPELCTSAMEVLAKIDFPNDRAFLHEMDKTLLEKFPYSYSVHRHMESRQKGELFKADWVAKKTVAALKDFEKSSESTLLKGNTIDGDACKIHEELPSELLRLAAYKELSGKPLDAMNLFQTMRKTMQKRPLFNEYAPFLVHYKKLLYRCSLMPLIMQDEKQLQICQQQILGIEEELSFITGGWSPNFHGTAKIQKMLKANEETDYAGEPLWIASAFKSRMNEVLPN